MRTGLPIRDRPNHIQINKNIPNRQKLEQTQEPIASFWWNRSLSVATVTVEKNRVMPCAIDEAEMTVEKTFSGSPWACMAKRM